MESTAKTLPLGHEEPRRNENPMPEVRLAWRAALCYGSPGSQVFVGVAPAGELAAVCRTLPRAAVRCYDLPGLASGVPLRGVAAAPNTLGVLPLVRQKRATTEDAWDMLLTVALREEGALAALAAEMSRPTGQEDHCFVASVALAPETEQALFETLGEDGPPAGLPALRQRVGSLCSRLASQG